MEKRTNALEYRLSVQDALLEPCVIPEHKLIIQLAGEGKSIMFISSEIEEMLRTCNRLAVLRDGAKVGELDGELTQERVMAAIAGGASNE